MVNNLGLDGPASGAAVNAKRVFRPTEKPPAGLLPSMIVTLRSRAWPVLVLSSVLGLAVRLAVTFLAGHQR